MLKLEIVLLGLIFFSSIVFAGFPAEEITINGLKFFKWKSIDLENEQQIQVQDTGLVSSDSGEPIIGTPALALGGLPAISESEAWKEIIRSDPEWQEALAGTELENDPELIALIAAEYERESKIAKLGVASVISPAVDRIENSFQVKALTQAKALKNLNAFFSDARFEDIAVDLVDGEELLNSLKSIFQSNPDTEEGVIARKIYESLTAIARKNLELSDFGGKTFFLASDFKKVMENYYPQSTPKIKKAVSSFYSRVEENIGEELTVATTSMGALDTSLGVRGVKVATGSLRGLEVGSESVQIARVGVAALATENILSKLIRRGGTTANEASLVWEVTKKGEPVKRIAFIKGVRNFFSSVWMRLKFKGKPIALVGKQISEFSTKLSTIPEIAELNNLEVERIRALGKYKFTNLLAEAIDSGDGAKYKSILRILVNDSDQMISGEAKALLSVIDDAEKSGGNVLTAIRKFFLGNEYLDGFLDDFTSKGISSRLSKTVADNSNRMNALATTLRESGMTVRVGGVQGMSVRAGQHVVDIPALTTSSGGVLTSVDDALKTNFTALHSYVLPSVEAASTAATLAPEIRVARVNRLRNAFYGYSKVQNPASKQVLFRKLIQVVEEARAVGVTSLTVETGGGFLQEGLYILNADGSLGERITSLSMFDDVVKGQRVVGAAAVAVGASVGGETGTALTPTTVTNSVIGSQSFRTAFQQGKASIDDVIDITRGPVDLDVLEGVRRQNLVRYKFVKGMGEVFKFGADHEKYIDRAYALLNSGDEALASEARELLKYVDARGSKSQMEAIRSFFVDKGYLSATEPLPWDSAKMLSRYSSNVANATQEMKTVASSLGGNFEVKVGEVQGYSVRFSGHANEVPSIKVLDGTTSRSLRSVEEVTTLNLGQAFDEVDKVVDSAVSSGTTLGETKEFKLGRLRNKFNVYQFDKNPNLLQPLVEELDDLKNLGVTSFELVLDGPQQGLYYNSATGRILVENVDVFDDIIRVELGLSKGVAVAGATRVLTQVGSNVDDVSKFSQSNDLITKLIKLETARLDDLTRFKFVSLMEDAVRSGDIQSYKRLAGVLLESSDEAVAGEARKLLNALAKAELEGLSEGAALKIFFVENGYITAEEAVDVVAMRGKYSFRVSDATREMGIIAKNLGPEFTVEVGKVQGLKVGVGKYYLDVPTAWVRSANGELILLSSVDDSLNHNLGVLQTEIKESINVAQRSGKLITDAKFVKFGRIRSLFNVYNKSNSSRVLLLLQQAVENAKSVGITSFNVVVGGDGVGLYYTTQRGVHVLVKNLSQLDEIIKGEIGLDAAALSAARAKTVQTVATNLDDAARSVSSGTIATEAGSHRVAFRVVDAVDQPVGVVVQTPPPVEGVGAVTTGPSGTSVTVSQPATGTVSVADDAANALGHTTTSGGAVAGDVATGVASTGGVLAQTGRLSKAQIAGKIGKAALRPATTLTTGVILGSRAVLKAAGGSKVIKWTASTRVGSALGRGGATVGKLAAAVPGAKLVASGAGKALGFVGVVGDVATLVALPGRVYSFYNCNSEEFQSKNSDAPELSLFESKREREWPSPKASNPNSLLYYADAKGNKNINLVQSCINEGAYLSYLESLGYGAVNLKNAIEVFDLTSFGIQGYYWFKGDHGPLIESCQITFYSKDKKNSADFIDKPFSCGDGLSNPINLVRGFPVGDYVGVVNVRFNSGIADVLNDFGYWERNPSKINVRALQDLGFCSNVYSYNGDPQFNCFRGDGLVKSFAFTVSGPTVVKPGQPSGGQPGSGAEGKLAKGCYSYDRSGLEKDLESLKARGEKEIPFTSMREFANLIQGVYDYKDKIDVAINTQGVQPLKDVKYYPLGNNLVFSELEEGKDYIVALKKSNEDGSIDKWYLLINNPSKEDLQSCPA